MQILRWLAVSGIVVTATWLMFQTPARWDAPHDGAVASLDSAPD